MERLANNHPQDSESREKYFLAAFLAPVIWGFMSVPVRLVKAWPAEDILFYRILVAVVVLWSFIFIFRKKKLHQDYFHFRSLPPLERKKVIYLTLMAAFLIFGNWYTYIYCINNVSVQAGAFAYILCPLITTAAGYFLLKEELSKIKKTALFLAFGSVIMLATGSLTEVLWSITIGGLYAFYLVIQRVVQGFDKLNVLAIQMAICTLTVIPSVLTNPHPIPDTPSFWIVIATIAIAFTIIPLLLSMYALKRVSSSTLGVMLYVNPIIAFVLAITYFHETIDSYKYWAYGLLVIAVFLFNSKTLFQLVNPPKKQNKS
ncbi:EamA family transporter [Sphingobacterium sp. SYP-B4668]|uniref:EamA family transporter n=1 Tax=Sphingobacterium sp. SYP-B4668 TaxID=2996035 RepID=UPI0022DE07E0|nr:EamA family transporter [Sphingobacterium sp. SYP-B4668]